MTPLLVLLGASVPTALAQETSLEIPFEEYQLENGLNVILHHDPSLPQVVVNTWYGVGSKDEKPGRSGFAHLFEHLMFMGTERLPGSGFDDLMEAHGGWNNAWTSQDATDYYDVGPSNLLDLLLWMEADRMDGLDAAMTQDKLDLQREVVRNERRQSSEDTPYGVLWLEMSTALYPEDHPYGHTVIGTHEDLKAATVDDVVGFFQSWYGPDNASLVVAGDFDVEATKQTIVRLFGGLAPVSPAARPAPDLPDLPVKPLVEMTDQVQIPMTVLAWHTDPSLSQGDAVLDVLASILGEGRSSRLYQRLVHEGLALEASAYQMSQLLSSVFMVQALPTEGNTIEDLEAILQEEIQKLATEGPTAEELERVGNNIEVSFLGGLEALQSRASALNRYRYVKGDPGWVQEDLARYRSVTAEDVKAAAAALTPERRCTLRVRPESTSTEEGGQ